MQKHFLKFLEKYDKQIQRSLEFLPGTFSWTLILFPFWASFFIPHVVAYLVLLFDVYWFYKGGTLAITATLAYFRLQAASRYDWLTQARKKVEFDKLYQIIIIPNYQEKVEKLRQTLKALVKQDFPRKQVIIVLAMEKREKEAHGKARLLLSEFSPKFGQMSATFHPDLPGEVKGKSSNDAWAGKFIKKKLVDQLGYDINLLTVTVLDADALLHPKYLSYLAYKFLHDRNRYRRFYQGAVQFYSNIWRVPAPIRVVNTFCSIWQTAQVARKDRLINYSCYSLSLKMLDEVGYWDTNVIPEDYRIFFKSYFKLGGKVDVEPIYLPISCDAAESTTFWKTMVNQYEQMKRWAWGTSDDPYIIKQWLKTAHVPFWDKTLRVTKVLEDHLLWPVNWFIITIATNIPPLVNPEFAKTVLGYNLPRFSFAILTACWIFLAIILIIDMRLRPPRPYKVSFIRKLLQPAEFILMPVVGFFFNALPGLDVHTRLILKKYIEYRVTEKV